MFWLETVIYVSNNNVSNLCLVPDLMQTNKISQITICIKIVQLIMHACFFTYHPYFSVSFLSSIVPHLFLIRNVVSVDITHHEKKKWLCPSSIITWCKMRRALKLLLLPTTTKIVTAATSIKHIPHTQNKSSVIFSKHDSLAVIKQIGLKTMIKQTGQHNGTWKIVGHHLHHNYQHQSTRRTKDKEHKRLKDYDGTNWSE